MSDKMTPCNRQPTSEPDVAGPARPDAAEVERLRAIAEAADAVCESALDPAQDDDDAPCRVSGGKLRRLRQLIG